VLGVEIFGQYGFAIAIITLFAVLSDKGLNTYQTRQTAFINDKVEAGKLIADSLYARLILGTLSFGILLLISLFLDKSDSFLIFFRFASLAMMVNFYMGSFSSTLLGFERFKLYGMLAMFSQLLLTSLSFIALYLGFSLIGIGVAHLIAGIVATTIVGYMVRQRVCRFTFHGTLRKGLAIIKSALPLAVTAVLMTIYYRADFVMLSIMKGDEAVGYYNSAYALINGLLLVSTSFSATVLPRLTGYYSGNHEQLRSLYQTGFKYMVYLGLATAFGTIFVALPVYQIFYPSTYLPGVSALHILIWALALMFINSLQSGMMIAADRKQLLMYLAAIGAVVNVGLNLILIPRYSYDGAAVATVISELITGIGFFIVLKEYLPIGKLTSWLGRLAPAILAMTVFLFLFPELNVIVRIIIGAVIFIGVLILVRGLDRRDLKLAFRLLPGGSK
jgi:O-antigen/teichoic acid export membrane protein